MRLEGKRIAYLVGPGFEDLEFWVPVMRLQEEGAEVTVVGIKGGETYTGKVALEAKAECFHIAPHRVIRPPTVLG